MSKEAPAFDFFGVKRENSTKSDEEKPPEQRRIVRGIQRTVSRINPQMLKNVIVSRAATRNSDGKSPENSLSPKNLLFPNKMARFGSEIPPATAQFTIFYNGTVNVFDVPPDKAEKIMKLAENGNFAMESGAPSPSFRVPSSKELAEDLNGDLPIARKKSLQRFLEKRKERLLSLAPYNNLMESSRA